MSLKRTSVLILLFTIILTSQLSAQLLDQTLATVRLSGTEVVNQRELSQQIDLVEQQLGQSLTPSQKREILDSRIDSILIEQAARREGLQASDLEIQNAVALQKQSVGAAITDAQFQQLIVQQTGISWEMYLEQLESRILQEKYIAFSRPNLAQNLPRPDEAQIRQVYEQNAGSFLSPAMSGITHIFIPTVGMNSTQRNEAQSRMDQFSRRIRSGGQSEFDVIVRESLDDPGYTGSELGYVISGDPNALQSLGQAFVADALAMAEGEISGVMESAAGFHILRINDRRSPRLLELDDPLFPGQSQTVRQNIIDFIQVQNQQQALVVALQEITEELRNEAEIRIFEQNLPW